MTQVLADRYELTGLLGSGGMARVYEARDRLLDRRVAVKLLREDITGTNGPQSVLSEARAAASFSHPHAVAVYDIGREGDRPFIVMEMVEGCTLAELLSRRGRMEPEQAVAVAGQTLSALEAAHRRGLVHRDVKPANILLPGCRVPTGMDDDHGVKLADFGIAKGIREAAGELTLAGKVIGTPTYLSPEQVGGRQATARSDVYSVGVVLYEMLAGHPPFSSETPVAMALAHQQQEPPRLDRVRPDLPAGVVELVHRALHKDPLDRYASAADMREALRHWRGTAAAVAPTLVDSAAGDDEPDHDAAPVLAGGGPSRMAGWRPAVLVGGLALVAVLLIAAVSALGGDPDAETAAGDDVAAETEQVPTEEPAVTEPPADDEPAGDDAPAGDAPADEGEGGGFDFPGLGDFSLPNPADVGAEQLRDVVGRLPGPVVGERRDDLESGLDDVVEAPEEQRPEQAGNLLDDVRGWMEEGGLSDQVGRFVSLVLERLAAG